MTVHPKTTFVVSFTACTSEMRPTASRVAIERRACHPTRGYSLPPDVLEVPRSAARACPAADIPARPSIESPKTTFLRGAGCNLCSQTGYFGRVGVYEVLSLTEEIRHLVVTGATPREVHDCAVAQGLRTLRHEAGRMVENDITTIDEVVRNVYVAEGML